MSDKKFAVGFYADRPHENAPSFVKARLSIKVDEAIEFLRENRKVSGYVDLDLKESKGGKLYLELNEWGQKEEAEEEQAAPTAPKQRNYEYPKDVIDEGPIPF